MTHLTYLDSVVPLPLMPLPVVGPSFLHLRGMPQAIACLPGARVWGPEGARVRRKKIAWTGELSAAGWPYQDELPLLELGGMAKVREVLFLHKASRTLIVTDLCFNLLDASGLGARFILGLFGTYQRFGVSRLFLRFVTDRVRFEASLNQLFAWEFDDIAISHGRPIAGGGRARLLAALQERGHCKDVK